MSKIRYLLILSLFLIACTRKNSQHQSLKASNTTSQISLISHPAFCPCGKVEEKSIAIPPSIQYVRTPPESNYPDVWNYFVSQVKNYQRPPESILCLDLFLPQFSIARDSTLILLDKHPWATNLYILLLIPDTNRFDSCSILLDTTLFSYWNLLPNCILLEKNFKIKGNALLLVFSSTPLYPIFNFSNIQKEDSISLLITSRPLIYIYQNNKTVKKKPLKWEQIPKSTRRELYALIGTYLHFLNKPIYGELKVNHLINLLDVTNHQSLKKLVQLSTFIPQ